MYICICVYLYIYITVVRGRQPICNPTRPPTKWLHKMTLHWIPGQCQISQSFSLSHWLLVDPNDVAVSRDFSGIHGQSCFGLVVSDRTKTKAINVEQHGLASTRGKRHSSAQKKTSNSPQFHINLNVVKDP